MPIAFIGDIHGKNSTPLGRLKDYNEDLFTKMEWIRDYCHKNGINTIVHLGDIYDKPEATDAWKNKFIQIWSKYKGKFYSIVGKSHDLFHNEENSYSRTCLYNLELSGVLTVLSEAVRVDDAYLVPLSMHLSQAKEQLHQYKNGAFDSHAIFLAHQFYNWELNLDAGFIEDDFVGLENVSIVLGHDHRQHKQELADKTLVVRPGSLMRTELSETMIEQKPSIAIFDGQKYIYVEVPHRPIDEIYDVTAYRSKKSNVKLYRKLRNNLESISKYLHKSDDVMTCSEGLKRLDCPEPEFEYLRAVHTLCSQEF